MKRSAFTLVELLAVIAIIAILAALLLVAINGARETARRNLCLSRQRDLALATLTYNTDNNGLPGVINQLGAVNPPHYLSWVVTILPMIGENKRYDFLTKDSPVNTEVAQATAPLASLLCPSDNPAGNGRLNYFANCGPIDYATAASVSPNLDFVLFKDRRSSLVSTNTKVKVEDIPDGASNTILLLEDIDRGIWHEPGHWVSANYNPNELSASSPTRNTEIVANLGFTWWLPESTISVPDKKPSRPLSKHVGIGNAAFADGSAKPISDDTATTELVRLFCPDDVKAKNTATAGGLGFITL